ncbi:MAG: hypothetical protein WD425_07585 [Nitrospirales bacterium]
MSPVESKMMKILIPDLHELLDQQEGPCLSLFMPAHPAGPEIRQEPIRLKNLLKERAQKLEQQGIRNPNGRNLPNHRKYMSLATIFQ